jgi:hypothetical protein
MFCIAFSNDITPNLKALSVKKITAYKNSEITNAELKKYLITFNQKTDSLTIEESCNDTDRIQIENWLKPKRIGTAGSCDGTNQCLNEFPRNPNTKDLNIIDYYYIKQNGAKYDSLIFINTTWQCPRYKSFIVFMDQYPFLTNKMKFNYIGNNNGNAAGSFNLKPTFWDKDQKKYTQFIPSVPVNDSSSLLVNSVSGFKVSYEKLSAAKATDKEKKIIVDKLFSGLSSVTCLRNMTIEKLATVGNVSRYIGQVQFSEGYLNSWFFADVEQGRCSITMFEVNRGIYSSQFCCAYSFGTNNLPDVYVWISEGDTATPVKEIIYKSNDRWVVTMTQQEYTGDCFDENEENEE